MGGEDLRDCADAVFLLSGYARERNKPKRCEDRIPCQQILSPALQRREDGHGCGERLESVAVD